MYIELYQSVYKYFNL